MDTRQTRLASLLADLQTIPGVSSAVDDDFTDTGFWVFVELQPKFPEHRGACYAFAHPIRSVKASIRRICQKHNIAFDFIDWPVKTYSYSGGMRFDEGYSNTSIKIDLYLPNPDPTPPPRMTAPEPPIRRDQSGRLLANWG